MQAFWNSEQSRGATFEVTEMQPLPPWALKPSAVGSSPESWMKSVPQVARCSETRSTLPVASFTPLMFLKSCASRPIVSGSMSITERPGML